MKVIPDRQTDEGSSQTRGISQHTFIHYTVEHFDNRQWVDLNPFSPFFLFIPSNMRDDSLNQEYLRASWMSHDIMRF